MLPMYLQQKKQEIKFDIIRIRWILTFLFQLNITYFVRNILSYWSCFFLCFLTFFYFESGKSSNETKSYMKNILLSEDTKEIGKCLRSNGSNVKMNIIDLHFILS